MKLPAIIRNLCLPAKVYLFLSLISLVLYLLSMKDVHKTVQEADPNEGKHVENYTSGGLLIKIVFTIVWVYILNYICGFKYGKKIAWFIVLLPFFFMALMLIGVMCGLSFIALQTEKNKLLQKELNKGNDKEKQTQGNFKFNSELLK